MISQDMLQTEQNGPQMPPDLGIPPEAMQYAQQAIASNQAPPTIDRAQASQELLSWCNDWFTQASSWRRTSYEDKWIKWQRNSDAIFDPQIAAKKKPWQSKAFVPMTPSHRENIKAQLYKTMVGANPPLEMKSRLVLPEAEEAMQQAQAGGPPPMGPFDQSDNIRDLISREMEKSRFEVGSDSILEDCTNLGTGFARMRFEEKIEDRLTSVPVQEPINMFDPSSFIRAMTGQRQVVGYRKVMQPALIYRGVRFEYISTWDIFPDPKALEVKGNTHAYRYWQTFGEIVAGVQEGWAMPESVDRLRGLASNEVTPQGQKEIEADRGIADSKISRPEYGVKHECYELYGRLPQKWVYSLLAQPLDITDPEKLVPARVIFHKATLIAVEINQSYDGEAPFFKLDYWPVAGQYYARGVPEMLKDAQAVSNETINQRLDDGSLCLATMLGVVEKAVVNPKELDQAVSGGIVRLNANAFGGQPFTVNEVLQRIPLGGIANTAFIEPQEWERWAKERTSANSVTLAQQGPGGDANETARGMAMLKESAGEKFKYIGMSMEVRYLYEVFRSYWKLIYANYQPQDVALALGPQRAQTFQMMSPEEVENNYLYIPQGVFEANNKAQRQATLALIRSQFAGAPWLNDIAFFDKELQSEGEDPAVFKVPEAEALQIMGKAQQMAQGMAQQMVQAHMANQPGKPGESKPTGNPGQPQ